MKKYTFQVGGKKYTVQDANGVYASPADAYNALRDTGAFAGVGDLPEEKPPSRPGMTHTESYSANPGGVITPVGGGMSDQPLSAVQQFQIGRSRGNDEEIVARLGGEVKTSVSGHKFWRPSPEEGWKPVNTPGLDLGDFPRVAGSDGPQIAGALATTLATGPIGAAPSILGLMGKAALGGMGGLGLDETAQSLAGTQRDSWQDVAQDLTQAGLEEGLGAGIGGMAARYMPGVFGPKPLDLVGSRTGEVVNNAIDFQAANPQFPKGTAGDLLSATQLGPVAGVMEKQATGLIAGPGAAKADAAHQAAQAAEGMFIQPPQAAEAASRKIGDAASRRMEDYQADRMRLYPGGEVAAASGKKATTDSAADMQREISTHYKAADAYASTNPPRFDITPLKRTQGEGEGLTKTELFRSGLLNADGSPNMTEVTRSLEMEDGPGVVRKVQSILNAADGLQTNHNALAALRTAIGPVTGKGQGKVGDAASRPADALYRNLTKVMQNPENKADIPEFMSAWETGMKKAGERARINRSGPVKQLARSEGAASTVREFAENPASKLTPDTRKMFDRAKPHDRRLFREGMQQSILDSPDPAAVAAKMRENTSAKEANDYLFESPEKRRIFEQRAEQMSAMKKGPIGQVVKAKEEQLGAMNAALDSIKTAEGARALKEGMTPGEQDALSEALISRVVNKVMSPGGKTGEMRVNPQALRAEIDALSKTGVWQEVLSGEQRKRVRGLQDYYSLFFNKMSDVGSSLEGASVGAALKGILSAPVNPAEAAAAVRAIHSMMQNRTVAKYMTNPKRFDKLVKRIKATPRDKRKWAAQSLLMTPLLNAAVDEEYGADLMDEMMGPAAEGIVGTVGEGIEAGKATLPGLFESLTPQRLR